LVLQSFERGPNLLSGKSKRFTALVQTSANPGSIYAGRSAEDAASFPDQRHGEEIECLTLERRKKENPGHEA